MSGIGIDTTGADLEARVATGAIESPSFDSITPGQAAPDVPTSGAFLPALYHAHNRYDLFVAMPRYLHAKFGAMSNIPEEGYNPFEGLDEKYAPFHSLLADVESADERRDMLAYIDMKRHEKEMADSNVYANLLGTLIGATATTIPLLPVGEMLWATNSLTGKILRGAAVGALVDIPFEAGLMATDPEFGLDEAWTGIALSALVGGAIEPFVSAPGAVARSTAQSLESEARASTAAITSPNLPAPSAVERAEFYKAVQIAEDGFKPSVRLTKSGEVTPEEYLAARGEEGLAPATGPLAPVFNKIVGTDAVFYQPNLTARLLTSESTVVRQLTNQLVEHNFLLNKVTAGKTFETPVEAVIEAGTINQVYKLEKTLDEAFVKYKNAGGKGTVTEFEELASKAARREDYSQPGVGEAARYWNSMMDDYLARGQQVDILKDVLPVMQKGSRYFTRVYDRDKMITDIAAFRQTVSEWVSPIISEDALKANPGVTAKEITAMVDKAVEDIRSNIMGNKYFDLEHLTWSDKSGKTRTIDIPDLVLEPFLKNNMRDIGKLYISRLEKDIALHQRFGTASKSKILQNVVDDYKSLLEKTAAPEEVAKLEKRMQQDLTHLEVIIDRITGTRGQQADPNSFGSKATRLLLPYNMTRSLGSIALTQMPELSRAAFQRFVISSGIVKDMERLGVEIDKFKLTRAEAKSMAAYLDNAQRLMQIMQGDDLLQNSVVKESPVISLANLAGQATAKWSGMQMMDNFTRRMLAEGGMNIILNAVKAAKAGKLTAKNKAFLNELGIGEDLLPQIDEMMAKHATTTNGYKEANLDRWEGVVGDTVRAGIRKHFLRHIVRPGAGDRFVFADSNNLTRLAMQFRSYMQSAWSRTFLPGMQRSDMNFVGSVVTMLMAGYLSMKIKDIANGYDRSNISTTKTVVDVISSSGALPYAFDIASYGMQTYATPHGNLSSKGNLAALFGPTSNLVATAPQALARLATDNLAPGDLRTLKSLIPLNNIVYWNWYANELTKQKSDEMRRYQKYEKSKGE